MQIVFLDRLFAHFCSRQWQIVLPNKFFCKLLFPTTFFDKLSLWTIFWQIVVPNSFLWQGDPGGPHGTGDSEGLGSPGGRGSQGSQGGQGGIVRQAV